MNLAEQLIKRVAATRKLIVVIGDTMRDVWVEGRQMPSQDGCFKFVQSAMRETSGGAGNAFRSISEWAVHTELSGHWIGASTMKTRFVEDGKVVFRHDHDVPFGGKYDFARRQCLEWVACAGGVLLSDYDKGFLTPELISQISVMCEDRNVPCVADVKRERKVYRGCITKGNEDWYIKYGIASVVTRGADVPAVSGNMAGKSVRPVKCINHVGAGDCFAAHLTLALTYGFTIEEAATIAHSAGRVYVQHPYNRPPLPQEIVADMLSVT